MIRHAIKKLLLLTSLLVLAPGAFAQVGAAKSAGAVTDIGGNVFEVTYTLRIENTHATDPQFDIQAIDDLSVIFGTPVGSAIAVDAPGEYFATIGTIDTTNVTGNTDFGPAPGFTGSGANTAVLDLPRNGSLNAGDFLLIPITVRFFPDPNNAPYENNFVASGDTAQNGTADGDTVDNSVNGTDVDPTANNDPTDDASATPIDIVSALTAFACTNDLYLVQNSPSQFNRINFGTSSLVPLGGTAHALDYNGIGYRSADNLVYGTLLLENELVVVDANGTVVGLGTITGLPNGEVFTSGEVIGNTLYTNRGSTSELWAVDLVNRTASLVGSGTDLDQVLDMALSPIDGQLYAVTETSKNLIRINPANAATTLIGATGITGVGLGSTYFDNEGNLFNYENGAGAIYGINTTNGQARLITNVAAATLTDGASCNAANPPVLPEIGTAKEAGAVTALGSNVFQLTYNLRIENTGATEAFDIQATESLAAAFGTAVGSVGAVNTAGEFFASVGTLNTAGITNGGNTAFAANGGYDGDGTTTILDPSSAGSLKPGDFLVIPVTVTFLADADNAPYTTQFTGAADSTENGVANSEVTDLSTNGTNVDQNGSIPGNDNDGDPTNTDSVTPIDVVPALTPFTCSQDFYQTTATGVAAPTVINTIDPLTSTFTPFGSTSHDITVNAVGYNTGDNLIYSIRSEDNELIVTDANGDSISLGVVSGLPLLAPGDYNAGDVLGGTLFVSPGNSADNTRLFAIDIASRTATLVGSNALLDGTFDFSGNPNDGNLYFIVGGNFYQLNPSTLVSTLIGATGGPAVFGASFIDNAGNLYGYVNSGEFWFIDGNTGVGTQLSTGPAVILNDGASCPLAAPPVTAQVGAAKNLVSLTDLGSDVYEAVFDLRIENTSNGTAFDIQATDDLTGSFGTPQAVVGDVDVAGEYHATINSIDTSGITNGGNTTFTANGGFTGAGANTALLNAGAAGTLNPGSPGDFIVIRVTVRFVPLAGNAPFDNQFTATSDPSQNGAAGNTFTDLSTRGTDVDANGDVPGNDGDGDPTNTDSTTPVTLPDLDGDTIPDGIDIDDDNDGIPDVTEGNGATNSDADAIPDHRDIDSDNDGIPDNIEAQPEGNYRAPQGVDTDMDGLDDEYDPDNGGTPIAVVNTDGAADPADYRDTDSDDDGILDSIEGHDANQDGIADVVLANADADSDGLDDNFDTVAGPAANNATGSNAPLQNSDGTDARDWRDIDDDNDGIPSVTEGAVNSDADARPNYLDIDADNDGIVDNIEAQAEGSYRAPQGADTDLDGLDNEYDPDNGGTAIVIANTDTADDPDYLDGDSDNDTIPDTIEGNDANRDGVADVTAGGADADNDGLDDVYDTVALPAAGNSIGSNAPLQNSDAVDNRDWRDTDDDNDGVDTSLEGGVANDADGDGMPDYLDTDDIDADGVPDNVDIDNDNDGIPDATEGNGDTDGDGVPARLDIDSDGDGIPDNIEAQAEGAYRAPQNVDANLNGLDDEYDPAQGGTAITIANTDTADNPDHLDGDSDNDGVPDNIEGHDANQDGVADTTPAGTDADGDGLDDNYDTVVAPAVGNSAGSNAPLQNSDGADNRDWRDTDDENDTLLTSAEGGVANDADGDGTPDYLDADDADGDGVPDTIDGDDDGDGIPDADEGNGATDTDGDGIPDSRDGDADGDGIPDNIEAQAEGAYRAPQGTDGDGDGIDDEYDSDNGGTPITLANTDGADDPDFMDGDSDNDGVPDSIEANDADSDGVADVAPSGSDTDGDGIDDAFDTVAGPAAGNATGSNVALQNTDGADERDWRDADDDNDGTPTSGEDRNGDGNFANDDLDADGVPSYLDDSDDIAALSGTVFFDNDSNGQFDAGDTPLETWVVELVQNGAVVATTTVAADGSYSFTNLLPGSGYEVRLRHPTTNATFEVLDQITLAGGDNLLNQNLPVDPSGVVYNTDDRTPLSGVTVAMADAGGTPLPDACALPGQQNQVTDVDGFYKIDLVLGADPACPSGATYQLQFTSPAGFVQGVSALIAPEQGALDPTGLSDPFLVQPQSTAPQAGDATTYYLQFVIENGDPNVIHNHVPLDPVGTFDVRITKTAERKSVSVGDLVPYTIEVRNVGSRNLIGVTLTDTLPGGFRLVDDSVTVVPEAAGLSVSGDKPLVISGLDLDPGDSASVRYFLRVGAGVTQGEYINTVVASVGTLVLGNTAEARVQVVADPDFEQTTIIGKVFDDRDGDGWQDPGERGIPGVRLATVTGLLIETDQHGRYHLAGVDVARFERGRNFYLKLDPTTLPEGTELISENPRVVRITQGLMSQIDFAVRVPQSEGVETIEIGEVFFESGSATVRSDYQGLLDEMAQRITAYPGGRITVLARAGQEALAMQRAEALRTALEARLGDAAADYEIVVKTQTAELSTRRGTRTTINADFFFDTDQDTVRAEYESLLKKLAEQIRSSCSGEITIEGHADPRGNVAYNQALSERRSEAVRRALERHGAFACGAQASRVHMTPLNADEGVSPLNKIMMKALAGMLNLLAASAHAAETPCSLDYCATSEGVAVRIISRGEQAPRQSGDSGEALQDGRRVSVRGELIGADQQDADALANRADVIGTMRTELSDGSGLWLTEDPLAAEPMFAFATPLGVEQNGASVEFPFYTNYAAFQDKLTLRVYRAEDTDRVSPVAELATKPAHLGAFSWQPSGALVGQPLMAVVQIANAEGEYDETRTQIFLIEDLGALSASERQQLRERGKDPYATIYGRNDIVEYRMPLAASRVRVHGDVRGDAPGVQINGLPIPLDGANRFAVEYLLPVGEHEFDVVVTRNGAEEARRLATNVSGQYVFFAGFADITASDNNVSGSVEALSGDDRYEDSFLFDGRLAFYLKGKIQGKYLITAHMDTREQELDEIFNGILDKDADAIFRRLDPDRYYPVYGDDSTTTSDVDTLGKLYFRVDWDQSQFIWGNYNTGITGNEFAQYNRSLYGAKLDFNSTKATTLGESKTHGKLFISEAQTAFGHAEFLGTGGSLYYLPHTDILPGSEKVTVEIRDRDSNRVVDTETLVRGKDYEVDEIQGRLILSRPLLQVRSRETSIIRNNPLDGDQAVMLVDYEYVPDGFDADHLTMGARGKQWIGDHLAVGGTYIHENRGFEEHSVEGLDLTVQKARGTYLKIEYAESEASQANAFFSDNGGLSFRQDSMTTDTGREGEALGLEARVNFQELDVTENEWTVGTWWRDTDRNFSVARHDYGVDLREYGVELVGRFSDKLGMIARRSVVERGSLEDDQMSLLLDYQLDPKNRIRLEVEEREMDDSLANVTSESTVAAFEFAHLLSPRHEFFGGFQGTLDEDGVAQNNDLAFAGMRSKLTDKLRLDTEVTYGHRGEGVTVGLDYARSERHSLYGSFTHSTDTTGSPMGGDRVTFGNRFKVSNQTTLFSENQFVDGATGAGFTHAFGVDYAPRPGWTLGASLQKGELSGLMGLVDRSTATLSAGFQSDRFNWRTAVEVRRDDGSERRDQVLTTNRMDIRATESVRLLGKYNFSRTDDNAQSAADARFTEAGLGLAYRPVDSNRFNMLMKYTYLYDLQSLGQFSSNTDQRSHILAAEGTLRLTPRWKLGAKVGHRKSELRANRSEGPWYKSTVDFGAVRLRYNIIAEWDAMVEFRRLRVREDDSVREGFLVGVDRHLGDHIKLGVGYSFADFSDDLRILDYEQRGFFVNLVGKI